MPSMRRQPNWLMFLSVRSRPRFLLKLARRNYHKHAYTSFLPTYSLRLNLNLERFRSLTCRDGRRRPLANSQSQYFPLIRFENFKAVALDVDLIPGRGDAARNMTEESSDRRYRLVGFLAELYA